MNQQSSALPMRKLGRTGLDVTIIGLGGYHVGTIKDIDLAADLVRAAIDEGVNFLDNAHCYHDGYSERVVGRALFSGGYRQRVVLMTKNHGRDAESFTEQLDASLKNLRTDCIDLIQFHSLSRPQEIEAIYAPGGALEAAEKARREGKVRFIGFTGHYRPAIHKAMIEQGFAWDTCQLPVNLLDAQYLSFQHEVLPLLHQRGIGVIGMKSLSNGRIMKAGVSASEAMRYAFSQPIDILISGIDSLDALHENLAVARFFEPMSRQEQHQLLERTASAASNGELEQYKQAGRG